MRTEYVFPTRAEEVKEKVLDYFVRPADSFYNRLLRNKAAILIGGRGTGKTMLLKSLAFEYKVNSQACETIFNTDSYLGCYIRIDSYVVSSFQGRGISNEDWIDLFAHYFNLIVCQKIIKTLQIISSNCINNPRCFEPLARRYYEIMGETCEQLDLDNLCSNIQTKLDELVRYINNPRRAKQEPTLINNGYLIFNLCDVLKGVEQLTDKTWFLLIDEYENLTVHQQKVVNTLIKANQPPVVFKVAMKPGGWWTKETLSTTESLEELADYDLINYERDLSDADYKELLIAAFRKALVIKGVSDQRFLDVRNYLPELSPEDEARLIVKKSRRNNDFIDQISSYIDQYTDNQIDRETMKQSLILPDDPLRTRLHLVLLERGKLNPNQIHKERIKNSSTYNEWYRHNYIGTLFLLCIEYRQRKTYCGFEIWVMLSSKIMRSFVSMYSRAWELSMEEGFSPNEPRPFTPQIQSRAAYDISHKKVFEISSYPSIGPNLYSFANHLGRIFERLNKDPKQSQPERNHLGVKGNVSNEAQNVLMGALLYSVLQEVPATKMRDDIDVRGRDYLFNRIYCPYYHMSYRKIHKLELQAGEFEALLVGADEDKRRITRKVLQGIDGPDTTQLDLLSSLTWGDAQ